VLYIAHLPGCAPQPGKCDRDASDSDWDCCGDLAASPHRSTFGGFGGDVAAFPHRSTRLCNVWPPWTILPKQMTQTGIVVVISRHPRTGLHLGGLVVTSRHSRTDPHACVMCSPHGQFCQNVHHPSKSFHEYCLGTGGARKRVPHVSREKSWQILRGWWQFGCICPGGPPQYTPSTTQLAHSANCRTNAHLHSDAAVGHLVGKTGKGFGKNMACFFIGFKAFSECCVKHLTNMSHWVLQEIHIFPRERYFGKEIGKICCFHVGFKSNLCLCRKAVGKTSEKILALALCLSNKIFFRYFWARAAIYITTKGPPTSERAFGEDPGVLFLG
jgi:hypothetical protein